MSWSEEQVIALSPDEASTKSGKDLSKAEKWLSVSKSEHALWGECKGSGSKPYQTGIDLSNIAFKCSCPSRKFPCKHGLGLLLLFARSPDVFIASGEPEWITSWLSKRAERDEKKSEKSDKPVDEAAQAKRQQARQLKVQEGIDELQVWIKDIIRNGLLAIPEKSSSYWENMAKRMVDAQAPGLERMVQNLSSTDFYTENWQSNFLDQLLRIYMVIKGFQNINDHSHSLQDDIRNLIGFTQNQEELKEQTGVTDNWIVLARQNVEDGSLTTEKYWLYGNESKKYALVLQFIINGQGKILTLTPGMTIQAELVFFSSNAPLRAIIKRQTGSENKAEVRGYKNWKEIALEETRLNSLLPLSTEWPFIIENAKPVFNGRQWLLMDHEGNIASIKESFRSIYYLLAISGGEPVTLAIVGSEKTYEPLGAWHMDKYYIL
jgi:hypothetical protein